MINAEKYYNELEKGMVIKIFQSGFRRYIHVNREAIQWNAKYKTQFPTIIIVDEHMKKHEFHNAIFSGIMQNGFVDGIEAKTFVKTYDQILAFKNPNLPYTFALRIKKRSFVKSILKKAKKFLRINYKNYWFLIKSNYIIINHKSIIWYLRKVLKNE